MPFFGEKEVDGTRCDGFFAFEDQILVGKYTQCRELCEAGLKEPYLLQTARVAPGYTTTLVQMVRLTQAGRGRSLESFKGPTLAVGLGDAERQRHGQAHVLVVTHFRGT